jgi:hypothetical protein
MEELFEKLAVSNQHSTFSQSKSRTDCDLLPINASAEGYKGKKTGKMTPIRMAKTTEKGLPTGRSPFGRM